MITGSYYSVCELHTPLHVSLSPGVQDGREHADVYDTGTLPVVD